MARALRPISHEDRLSLVDHLDELRRRLIISVVTLLAAFGFCFWQEDAVLDIVTKPYNESQHLDTPSKTSKDPLEQAARFQKEQAQALGAISPALSATATTLTSLRADDKLSAAQRRRLNAIAARVIWAAALARPR